MVLRVGDMSELPALPYDKLEHCGECGCRVKFESADYWRCGGCGETGGVNGILVPSREQIKAATLLLIAEAERTGRWSCRGKRDDSDGYTVPEWCVRGDRDFNFGRSFADEWGENFSIDKRGQGLQED